MKRHGAFCRLVMAFARRRVCTCGKSKPLTKQQERSRWFRRRARRIYEHGR